MTKIAALTRTVCLVQGLDQTIPQKEEKEEKGGNLKISYTFVQWQKCHKRGNPLIRGKKSSLLLLSELGKNCRF